MHAVLRNFVDAAGGGFLVEAIKLIEGTRSFADSVTFLDGFEDISLRENQRLLKLLPQRQLRGDRGGKRATGTVGVLAFHMIAAKRIHFASFAEHIRGFLEMAAGDDRGF